MPDFPRIDIQGLLETARKETPHLLERLEEVTPTLHKNGADPFFLKMGIEKGMECLVRPNNPSFGPDDSKVLLPALEEFLKDKREEDSSIIPSKLKKEPAVVDAIDKELEGFLGSWWRGGIELPSYWSRGSLSYTTKECLGLDKMNSSQYHTQGIALCNYSHVSRRVEVQVVFVQPKADQALFDAYLVLNICDMGFISNMCTIHIKKVTRNPAKITKILSNLDLPEKEVKKFGEHCQFKDKEYELLLTKQYFYEHYRALGESQSIHSCMSKTPPCYGLEGKAENGSDLHPLLAIENTEDIALALLVDKTSKKDYPVVLRTLVNLEKEGYIRTYGIERGSTLLKEMQLYQTDLDGCEIHRIETKQGGILCPYLDGPADTALDYGDHLEVCCYGGTPNYETGCLSVENSHCDWCHESADEDDLYSVYDGHGDMVQVCGHCRDNDFCWIYSREEYHYYGNVVTDYISGEHEHTDDVVYLEDVEDYSLPDNACYDDETSGYYTPDGYRALLEKREEEEEEEEDAA